MAMLIKEISEQPQVLKKMLEFWPGEMELAKLKSKRVFIFGTGASLSACMQAKYAFLHYGTVPNIVPAFETEYYIPLLQKEDLVLIISQSGESYETKVICEELLKKGIPFWGLTNQPDSFLGRNAARCLPLLAGSELGTATKTQTASLMALYRMAAGEDEAGVCQLEKIPRMAEETIKTAKGYMDELIAFVGDGDRFYLTGLDEQAPTALQGSLMLKEKVWIHAEGMALAEFRHGPVEVLKEGMPVILIGSSTKLDTLLCHARFLRNVCHASVAIMTNLPERKIEDFPNFPYQYEGNDVFGQLCATIPFQLLAERMADLRNYDIDGFQYIGKVLNQYETAIQ